MDQNAATSSANPASQLSESLEDYLEAIFAIEAEKQAARVKDIARRLSVSAPSVTHALQSLSARQLVNYTPYEVVTLTERGRKLALDVTRRHEALRRFFTDLLHLDPAEAEEAACHMEHALPPRARHRLVQFMDFICNSPHGGLDWSDESGFVLHRTGLDPAEFPPSS